MILRLLRAKGILSDDEYRLAILEEPNITGLQRKVDVSIAKVEAAQAQMSSAVPPKGEELPVTEGVEGSGEENSQSPENLPDTNRGVPEEHPSEKSPADGAGKDQ